MTVEFKDHQDHGNPWNGKQITNSSVLRSLLDGLQTRAPFFCELIGDNGFKLLLGVDAERCCVQHSPSAGTPPYLMAVGRPEGSTNTFKEFLTANTLTPVAERYCLPFEMMKEIAMHFVDKGERAGSVLWEEI